MQQSNYSTLSIIPSSLKKNRTYLAQNFAFQEHMNANNREHQVVSLCCLPMTQLSSCESTTNYEPNYLMACPYPPT